MSSNTSRQRGRSRKRQATINDCDSANPHEERAYRRVRVKREPSLPVTMQTTTPKSGPSSSRNLEESMCMGANPLWPWPATPGQPYSPSAAAQLLRELVLGGTHEDVCKLATSAVDAWVQIQLNENTASIESQSIHKISALVQKLAATTSHSGTDNVGSDVWAAFGSSLWRWLKVNVNDPEGLRDVVEGFLAAGDGPPGRTTINSMPSVRGTGMQRQSQPRFDNRPHQPEPDSSTIGYRSGYPSPDGGGSLLSRSRSLVGQNGRQPVATPSVLRTPPSSGPLLSCEDRVVQVQFPEPDSQYAHKVHLPLPPGVTAAGSLDEDELNSACRRAFGSSPGFTSVVNLANETSSEDIWIACFDTSNLARAALTKSIRLRGCTLKPERQPGRSTRFFISEFTLPHGQRVATLSSAVALQVASAFAGPDSSIGVQLLQYPPDAVRNVPIFSIHFEQSPHLLRFYIHIHVPGVAQPIVIRFRAQHPGSRCPKCGARHKLDTSPCLEGIPLPMLDAGGRVIAP